MIPEYCYERISFDCGIVFGTKGIEFGLIVGILSIVVFFLYRLIRKLRKKQWSKRHLSFHGGRK